MKKVDISIVMSFLSQFVNNPMSARLAYSLAKNLEILKNEQDILDNIRPNAPEDYNEDRNNKLIELALKDENGEIIWEKENQPKFVESEDEIISKLEQWEKENYLDFYNKKVEYVELLNEDFDADFRKFSIDDFEKAIGEELNLTPKDMILLSFMFD